MINNKAIIIDISRLDIIIEIPLSIIHSNAISTLKHLQYKLSMRVFLRVRFTVDCCIRL